MKITDKPKKNLILTVAALVVVFALAAGGSYAAYTSQGYQKGVVRNRDNESVRFTSNHMINCSAAVSSDNYPGKTVLYSDDYGDEDKLTLDIFVYNYVYGNSGLISEKDIEYTMNILLSGLSGTDYAGYTVEKNKESVSGTAQSDHKSILYTTDSTLIGREARADVYTVTFYGKDLNGITVTASAIAKDTSITNGQILAAVIAPCKASTVKQFSYSGTFTDKESGALPGAYDAFNYEVEISAGRAEVIIDWDEKLFEIDQFFIDKLTSRDKEKGWTSFSYDKKNGTLKFIMDQSEGMGDYLIPFYLASPQAKLPATWEAMDSHITIDATLIE